MLLLHFPLQLLLLRLLPALLGLLLVLQLVQEQYGEGWHHRLATDLSQADSHKPRIPRTTRTDAAVWTSELAQP
jgi:hypothetical protein